MSSSKHSEVQRLHRAVSQRETRYLQVINDRLPGRLASLIENNFFTSIALYTVLLVISFFLSIIKKTSETDVAQETKKLASEAKQNFDEEKKVLNEHFEKVLEETKSKASDEAEQAKELASTTTKELQAKAEAAKEEADQRIHKLEAHVGQTERELANKQQESQEQERATKKAADEFHVQISDLHYQIAEKDKRIRALESVESRLEAELRKEKELHETSKEALHDAVEKLIHAKQQFTNVSNRTGVA